MRFIGAQPHLTAPKALAADAVGGFNRLLCRHALQ